ncbi:hypothetical protein LTR97_009105 [Elasticomyces elasticus]|uniref:Uncharacterized protein n=1 Tax=Elasticomyces elasticus TaxID=574655 RepID=A0AAN7ZXA3_9PEZI|nr:hypothetical protein LTR97_009105 [Elasticomyces elasticus]KAK5728262.1 hypothetical protein LTR15_001397 [Elasticomyces elasticus]
MATRHRDSSNAPEVYEMHSDLETVLVNTPARRALELPPRESNFRNDARHRSSFFREWQQFRLSRRKRRPFASRLFWVIFGATIIVLTVAVGGGVGGSLAKAGRFSSGGKPNNTSSSSVGQASTSLDTSNSSTLQSTLESTTSFSSKDDILTTHAFIRPTTTIIVSGSLGGSTSLTTSPSSTSHGYLSQSATYSALNGSWTTPAMTTASSATSGVVDPVATLASIVGTLFVSTSTSTSRTNGADDSMAFTSGPGTASTTPVVAETTWTTYTATNTSTEAPEGPE